jgi:hypothetical protein
MQGSRTSREVELSDFGPRGELGRIKQRSYQRGGLDRDKRLQITIGAGAAILLLLGVGLGFSIGRATAPKSVAPAPVVQTETTMPVASEETTVVDESLVPTDNVVVDETSSSAETPLADTTKPPTPKQLAPANGAILDVSRVSLRWSKVKDDSGSAVTYSFEIQNRLSGGSYGNAQVITGIKSLSYSARVLTMRRRWRVWAVDEAGNASPKSGWHSYIHKYVAPKKSTDSSSTATSGTAQ